ncbi:MAG TPA: hypothetical protein VHU91_00030 [Mycobacteriales bacterium]|jgi:hypothetical protein|nr:hypothetical protein [Mycobacteriales bacterium]
MLVVTGGGPGIMEAGNLGSYFSGRSDEDLDQALDMLAGAADRNRLEEYFGTALQVRDRFPLAEGNDWTTNGGLAMPTWKYSHEPSPMRQDPE